MAKAPNSEFHCSKTPQDGQECETPTKGKGGRPKDANSLIFASVGLTAKQWAHIMQWAEEGDETNRTKALGAFVNDAKKWVARPGFARDRDAKGRWLPDE